MLNFDTIVDVVTVVILGLISITAFVFRKVVETAAEDGAKTAIKNINWPEKLRQELERARGLERQELRFKSYGGLWHCLHPLAVYSEESLDRGDVAKLSKSLTDWYFSECGGMFLTSHAREFYFAFQDLARTAGSASDDWTVRRPPGDHKQSFQKILKDKRRENALATIETLSDPNIDFTDWPPSKNLNAKGWRNDIATLGKEWSSLMDHERFVVLQQVGSILRTVLSYDVESRLR